jgi:hypothetical protein
MVCRSVFRSAVLQPWLVASLVLLVIAGCGGDKDTGPERYGVSGTVTFDGKPVPHGTIIFSPDSSKQNSGPQGMAEINDGAFDTAKDGRGMVGGPHLVTISGLERAPTGADDAPRPLFVEHTTKVDLPKEPSTQTFDVPKSAAKNLPKDMGPPP